MSKDIFSSAFSLCLLLRRADTVQQHSEFISRRYLVIAQLVLMLLLAVPSIYAANRYWVGASDGVWHSTSNWSNTSGGSSGYSIPGSADVAIFDAGSTRNCTITSNIDVQGIVINMGYSGTILLSNGVKAVVTEAGFKQTGGVFSGSGGEVLVNGPFDLSGGLFTINGILDVGLSSVTVPAPDIFMGF